MDPVAKTKLIESLYKVLVSLGVLSPENVKVIIYRGLAVIGNLLVTHVIVMSVSCL